MEAIVAGLARRPSAQGHIPHQEYLLQGSVLDTKCEILLHRLRGLCDIPDTPTETFHDHEMVFVIRSPNGNSQQLRVRKALNRMPAPPYHLRYLSNPEISDKARSTIVRSCIDVSCSSNVESFLQDLGFRLDYQYRLNGYIFRKGRMKIIVAKVFACPEPPVYEAPTKPITESYIVEMSLTAPAGQEAISDEMKSFAEQLKPLLNLEKLDYRKIATQTLNQPI